MRENFSPVIKVQLPAITPEIYSSVAHRHDSLDLPGIIATRNLEWSATGPEQLIRGLPDHNELSQILGISSEEMLIHLAVETQLDRIACIGIENTVLKVSRKTNGFVSARSNVLEVLLERTSRYLEDEYRARQRNNAKAEKIITELRAKVKLFESTMLGRLYHIYEGLLMVRQRSKSSIVQGNPRHIEVVRTRIWKMLEMRAKNSTKVGVSATREDGSFGASLAASSYPVMAVPGVAVDGAIPTANFQRAEDSDEWKRLEKQGGAAKGSFEWDNSFRSLGPFFTVRILLRREEFYVIETWLETLEVGQVSDLGRILADCETTLQRLIDQGAPSAHVDTLQRIIERMGQLLY